MKVGSLTANSIGITLVSFVYEYIKIRVTTPSPFLCSFLACGSFYFRLFLLYHLGSCHCQTLPSVCSWRKGIDGPGIKRIQSPIFSGPIDFLFMGKPLPCCGSSGSGKSVSFKLLLKSVLFPIVVKS